MGGAWMGGGVSGWVGVGVCDYCTILLIFC